MRHKLERHNQFADVPIHIKQDGIVAAKGIPLCVKVQLKSGQGILYTNQLKTDNFSGAL